MGARSGGETDQQNVTMHKAYCPAVMLLGNKVFVLFE